MYLYIGADLGEKQQNPKTNSFRSQTIETRP